MYPKKRNFIDIAILTVQSAIFQKRNQPHILPAPAVPAPAVPAPAVPARVQI